MPDVNTLIYTVYHKDLGILFIEDINNESIDKADIEILYNNTIKETSKYYDIPIFIIQNALSKDKYLREHGANE